MTALELIRLGLLNTLLAFVFVPLCRGLTWGDTKFLMVFGDSYTTDGQHSNLISLARKSLKTDMY